MKIFIHSVFSPQYVANPKTCSKAFTAALETARQDSSLTTEGRVSRFFSRALKGAFKNASLTQTATTATGGKTHVYITSRKLIDEIGSRAVGPADLRDATKARYLYCEGEGEGSLLDLVAEGGITKFPNTAKGVWEPKQLKTRTRGGAGDGRKKSAD